MNSMLLVGKASLHVVDNATRFFVATFIVTLGESHDPFTEEIWLAILVLCRTIYIDYQDGIQTDKGSVFLSKKQK